MNLSLVNNSTGASSVRLPVTLSVLLFLMLVAVVSSLSVGSFTNINVSNVLGFLIAGDGSTENLIVTSIRLPRTIAAGLIGGNLAVAGVLMQGATRNPLASPSIFGVSAGASLVVAIWAAFSPAQNGLTLVTLAFVGAAIGGSVVLLAGGALSGRSNVIRMALAGVAVSAVLSALTQGIVVLDESSADRVLFWLAGSVHNTDWSSIRTLLPWSILGVAIAIGSAFFLNILALGDELSSALGRRPSQVRIASFIAVIILTGVSVAIAGPISFLGLVVPHLARKLFGADHRVSVPMAFLLGGTLMISADVLSRFVDFPFETPSGVLTAIVGAPFFLYLARRQFSSVGAVVFNTISSSTLTLTSPRKSFFTVFPAIAIFSLVSLGVGAVWISPPEILQWISGTAEPHTTKILYDFRAPRIVGAIFAGSALAVSGVLIQSIIRNPLAAPEIIGISGGAGLAAVLLFVFVSAVSTIMLTSVAFVGGATTAGIVYLLAFRSGVSPTRLALVGIAITTISASFVTLLLAKFPQDLNVALLWLAGSLWGREWGDIIALSIVALVLLPIAVLLAAQLDVIALGEHVAIGLGIRTERLRLITLVIAVGLASTAVATVGSIAFIGLMAPHAARLLVGNRHILLIPMAAGIGTVILLIADAVGRGLFAPTEIPAGIFTALVGGPYFLFLLSRTKD